MNKKTIERIHAQYLEDKESTIEMEEILDFAAKSVDSMPREEVDKMVSEIEEFMSFWGIRRGKIGRGIMQILHKYCDEESSDEKK